MPSVSRSQQQAAAIAYATKKGKIPKSRLRGASKQMADSMSEEQLKHFAETPKKGLPEKKAFLCPMVVKTALHPMIPITLGIGTLGYIGARKLTEPDRIRLKKDVEDELGIIPLINPKHSTVEVRPGILNPASKIVEVNLRVSPSISVLSKSKSMFGHGTVDFSIPGRLFNKEISIDSIYLKDKYRGKGVGKSFAILVDNVAKKRNIPKVSVVADEEGKYFWSRVEGMEVSKSQLRELRKRYKGWCKKNNKKVLPDISSIKDFPKEFLLSDDAETNPMGFIEMHKVVKTAKISPLLKSVLIGAGIGGVGSGALKAGIGYTVSKKTEPKLTFSQYLKADKKDIGKAVRGGVAFGGLIGGVKGIKRTIPNVTNGIGIKDSIKLLGLGNIHNLKHKSQVTRAFRDALMMHHANKWSPDKVNEALKVVQKSNWYQKLAHRKV